MNLNRVINYLEAYKANFELVNQEELYKWKAVKQFKDHWDIEAEDFHGMLQNSLSLVYNLLDSGQYFPKRMLLSATALAPDVVRELFRALYDENEDIYDRIENFRAGIITLINENFEERNHYQDHRAIAVYLALNYPDRFYIYKFRMFKEFGKLVEYPYRPAIGNIANLRHFNSLAEDLRLIIQQDQDLVRMHYARLNDACYIDEELHILTQDFIYAVVRHLPDLEIPELPENENILATIINAEELKALYSDVDFTPRTTNYLQNEKENKRIGDLGELFVLEWEKEQFRNGHNQHFALNVTHHARDLGDGLGYDILSKTDDNKDKYIEVKTTKGSAKTPFFVTRNELERSRKDKDQFCLYRVFNFNDKTMRGEILIVKGDLSSICVEAVNYRIRIKN